LTYDLAPIAAPRLAGASLRLVTTLLESRLTRWALLPTLLKNAGLVEFRKRLLDEVPTVRPVLPRVGELHERAPVEDADLDALAGDIQTPGFGFETVMDFARAYREGDVDPVQVAQRVLAALEESDAIDPPMRVMIAVDRDDVLAQAEASSARLRKGAPIGPFDGVPVAVKDELDQVPFPTTVGTRFMGREPATEDATVVGRMRAAGALLIGKANMHEIGIGVNGLNPHHGTARNPYDPAHYTGGSSSGPAAAVAAGLCPVSIGADGGGSIRTPASLCGVVGLKATYGRISEHGAAPLCSSVGHVGPFGATALDTLLGYAAMAGPDPRDTMSLSQPVLDLGPLGGDLEGVTLGIYRPWFEDAEADVVAANNTTLEALQERGAKVREVEIPDLDLTRVAHLVTISSEMLDNMQVWLGEHRGEMGHDVRTSLALAESLTNLDYIRAQKARTRASDTFERVLEQVDAVITPTTGRTAPAIPADALPGGESDLAVLSALMRFVFPSNLTGHPAISFPAGYDAAGLPVGMQAIGRPWCEMTLLRIAAAAEQWLPRQAPKVHFRLLDR
jgi:Asp-tRNA(Asn)/Glu-tRNA(Gln) amidotransferase A subunit family amidase